VPDWTAANRIVILYKTAFVMSPSGKPVILVVDDDCDVRDALADLLEDAGYQPVCKQDGREALQYLRKQAPPAAVLLDLFMPEMNGWRFAEQLRQRVELAKVPVIVVTAAGPYWGTPVPKELVLRKPFQRAHLLRLLEQVVGST
jgi:CheY-like chemotaxis protein